MKEYKFTIGGKDYVVAINGIQGNLANVSVNGVRYDVEIEESAHQSIDIEKPRPARKNSPVREVQTSHVTAASPSGANSCRNITSPLPGVILSVGVKVGDKVQRGQKVAVVEAMKMENDILASKDGTVTAIHVSKGDSILEGASIISIE